MVKQIFQKKFLLGIILVVIVIFGYFIYQKLSKNNNAPRYLIATVEKGTLISSVSGSGQVLALNQTEIKAKVSGDVVYIGVKNGQEIKAGTLIVQIEAEKAKKAVSEAETALETAKLELEKLLQPPDQYTLMQAENALIQAKDNLAKLKMSQESKYQDALKTIEKAEDNLEKAYEDGFNTVANTFLDLPSLVTGLRNILYSYEISQSDPLCSNYNWNISCLINIVEYNERDGLEKFIKRAEDNYKTAKEKYDENFENYKNASRYSDKEIIEALINETIETAKAIAETIKSETNMLDYWVDLQSKYNQHIFSKVIQYQSDLKSYTSKINSHLSNLLSIQRTIKDNKEAKLNAERDLKEMEQNNPLDLAAAERNVKEKEEALAKLKAGPDELEIRAKKINVWQKENALKEAKQNLADYYVRAPFDGLITNLNVKKGETISSGTTIATLITKQKIAEITLNEIDVAKVKLGQKANLTFDAIEDLNLTGEVVEVDTIGQVSQGVVSYKIKITLDTDDERIKPGMSLSASIITEAKQNVLLVPNSAIKKQGDISYVQLVNKEAINQLDNKNRAIFIPTSAIKLQPVQIGLSNETMTEILDGLKEEDVIIVQTITSGSISTQGQRTQGGFNQGINPNIIRMMR